MSDKLVDILTTMEIAYFAGLFDGEGCISIVRGGPTITVAVVQVDRRPLDLLAARFGGSVMPHGKPVKETHHQAYRWQIYSGRARDFLRTVRPYLIVKAEKTDLVMAMPNPRKHVRKTPANAVETSQNQEISQEPLTLV